MASFSTTIGLAAFVAAVPGAARARAVLQGSYQANVRVPPVRGGTSCLGLIQRAFANNKASAGRRQQTEP